MSSSEAIFLATSGSSVKTDNRLNELTAALAKRPDIQALKLSETALINIAGGLDPAWRTDFLINRAASLERTATLAPACTAARTMCSHREHETELAQRKLQDMKKLADDAEQVAQQRRAQADLARMASLEGLNAAAREADEALARAVAAHDSLEESQRVEDARLVQEQARIDFFLSEARTKSQKALAAAAAAQSGLNVAIKEVSELETDLSEQNAILKQIDHDEQTALAELVVHVRTEHLRWLDEARATARAKLMEQEARAKIEADCLDAIRAEGEALEREIMLAMEQQETPFMEDTTQALTQIIVKTTAETVTGAVSQSVIEEATNTDIESGNKSPADVGLGAGELPIEESIDSAHTTLDLGTTAGVFESAADEIPTVQSSNVAAIQAGETNWMVVNDDHSFAAEPSIDKPVAFFSMTDLSNTAATEIFLDIDIQKDYRDEAQATHTEIAPANSQPNCAGAECVATPDLVGLNDQTELTAVLPAPESERAKQVPTLRYKGRVRSGQEVNHEGNIVVEGQVHPGGLISAVGDIHVYGTAAGRLIAGVNGETTACIYVQSLEAEMVSIAGRYYIFEEILERWKDRPIRFSLNSENRLSLEAIAMMPGVAEESSKAA